MRITITKYYYWVYTKTPPIGFLSFGVGSHRWQRPKGSQKKKIKEIKTGFIQNIYSLHFQGTKSKI